MTGVRGPKIETSGRGGRFYLWKKKRYWSVTTIIGGGLPKPVLVNWAKKFTAEYAVAHIEELKVLVEGDPKGAIDWLKGAAYRDRDSKADLGSIVHDASEAHVLGRPYPPVNEEQQPYMDAFLAWIEDFQPTFEAVEAPCFSDTHRYAGTLDAIAVIDGKRYLLDYKTGKGVYPEVGLQLAAYRYSETFIGLPNGEEAPTPKVDGCAVVHLRPEGYSFVPIRADHEVFNAFLFCREVFRFTQDIAGEVVGEPMRPSLQQQLADSLGWCRDCGHSEDMHPGGGACAGVLTQGEPNKQGADQPCTCTGLVLRATADMETAGGVS